MRIKQLIVLTLATFAFSFSGCADINSGIKSMNETLYRTESTLGGVYEQNISKVIAPLPSKKAVKNVSEAYDTMQKSLSIIACARKGNPEYYLSMLKQYCVGPNTLLVASSLPISYDIKKHNDGCLKIKKILNYKELADDEFQFSVIYVSNQSGESAQETYDMKKLPGNEWYYSRFYW